MASKKPKSSAEGGLKDRTIEVSKVETIVVGAGASGLSAARSLQKRYPAMQILVLEADERVCSRLQSGFQLVDSAAASRFDIHCANPSLGELKVRWEREWMNPDQVEWNSEEWWAPSLPQWRSFDARRTTLATGLKEGDLEVAVKTRTPVRSLSRADGADELHSWVLETPETTYYAQRVIWAAGLTAFQNAVGKKASQKYLAGNPVYNKEAADYRGALCMELRFVAKPAFVNELSGDELFAVPVRHNSKFYLLFAAMVVEGEGALLKTAAHLPQEILADPKELVSFQKAIRRTLKNVLAEGEELPPEAQSRWIVDDRGPAHLLGTMWVLGEGIRGSLEFVGEETLAAARSSYVDVLAALDSVNNLSWVSNPQESSLNAPSELQVS